MILICVLFTFISEVILLPTSHANVEVTGRSDVMQCKGSSLTLNEPDKRITQLRVFRGGELLASTTVPATGDFQDRLIVASDGRVTLENLSADDVGGYRLEVKLSEGRAIQRTLRLLVIEPPQTDDGSLAVNKMSSSGSSSVRLTCGNFTSLGFPPVSVVWENPLGHLLPSDRFKGQTFYLDLPVDTAEPGDYCCRLDCRPPTHCCLEERSPFRQCAQVHVQTGKTAAKMKITDNMSVTSFSQLQQQVLDMAAALRLLQESEGEESTQSRFSALTSDVTNLKQSLENVSKELADLRTDTEKLRADLYCPVRKGYSLYGGRCLKFDTRSVDFNTARANCLAEGAHLLTIRSRDIDGPPLQDAARAAGITGGFLRFWAGATRVVTEGTFLWPNGTFLSNLSPLWRWGEPNNDGGIEDCVEVLLDTTSMLLNDVPCGKSYNYFCQYDSV